MNARALKILVVRQNIRRTHICSIAVLLLLIFCGNVAIAQDAIASTADSKPRAAVIPFDQIGAVAGKVEVDGQTARFIRPGLSPLLGQVCGHPNGWVFIKENSS